MLFGNLTRDPELRALPSGMNVVNFSIATNRTYKDRDGKKQEQTDFHNVVVFGRQADVVNQYLKKGRSVFVDAVGRDGEIDHVHAARQRSKLRVAGQITEQHCFVDVHI